MISKTNFGEKFWWFLIFSNFLLWQAHCKISKGFFIDKLMYHRIKKKCFFSLFFFNLRKSTTLDLQWKDIYTYAQSERCVPLWILISVRFRYTYTCTSALPLWTHICTYGHSISRCILWFRTSQFPHLCIQN